jgi:citronellol/citronellal dehydrogenase
MSMLTLGLAKDEPSISANCLWPRTIIATAAVQNLLGGDEAMAKARTPAIVADAAYEILKTKPGEITGQALIDDEVLGDADLSGYSADGADLQLDIFVANWG